MLATLTGLVLATLLTTLAAALLLLARLVLPALLRMLRIGLRLLAALRVVLFVCHSLTLLAIEGSPLPDATPTPDNLHRSRFQVRQFFGNSLEFHTKMPELRSGCCFPLSAQWMGVARFAAPRRAC